MSSHVLAGPPLKFSQVLSSFKLSCVAVFMFIDVAANANLANGRR